MGELVGWNYVGTPHWTTLNLPIIVDPLKTHIKDWGYISIQKFAEESLNKQFKWWVLCRRFFFTSCCSVLDGLKSKVD